MKLLELRALSGPNIYHNKPVLVATLDLEDLAEVSSVDLPCFIEQLLETLPGLDSHRCSLGRPGGFVERLHRGTYFAHIVEHIALELSTDAEISVGFGKSIYGGAQGIYKVIVRYESEEGMKFLLQVALELADSLAHGNSYDLSEKIDAAKRLVSRTNLGPSTQSIVAAAEKRGIPWWRMNEDNLIQFGYGKYRKFIQATTTSQTNHIAVDIAQDKELTKRILSHASIKVPRGYVVYSEDEALEALRNLGKAVVVKPLDGHHGKGASIKLTTNDEVKQAFQFATEYCRAVLVEEYYEGRDFRILVVDGKMVAAAERIPAHVIGDGVKTIAELIEKENLNPRRGEGHSKSMSKIEIDDATVACLRRFNRVLTSVPSLGEIVSLKMTANLSTGGSAHDVTEEVHPEIKSICERAARVIGLDVCGIDLIAQSIAYPLSEQQGGIIEVNAGPGIRMHHFPSKGKSRDIGGAIVEMLFPKKTMSRVPILSITGTNGKTSVTRMIGHAMSQSGLCVGMTTSDGIYIDQTLVEKGDTTGPASARVVLCDPAVEIAVLETARGGIVRRGLGYDWSDVGVLTNVQADHIGQDGIETIEDILRIKSVVAERVREGGSLILNADDERLAVLPESKAVSSMPREIIYFSLRTDQILIKRHLMAGGKAYFLDSNGWLVESIGNTDYRIMQARDIPASFNGTASFHIQNALAAIAACRSQGLSVDQIVQSLMTFSSNNHNQGRTNIFRVNEGYLLLDFGHNMNAFKAIANMTQQWDGRRVTGIIALPGDRSDEMIKEGATAAAKGFDKILIREDTDLRGRESGEVASIIYRTIQEIAPSLDCKIVLDEGKALRTAISEMEPGEVVVLFYDKFDVIAHQLKALNAIPVSSIQSFMGEEYGLRNRVGLNQVSQICLL